MEMEHCYESVRGRTCLCEATHCVLDARVGVKDQGDNETVQTQHFSENEDKNLDEMLA